MLENYKPDYELLSKIPENIARRFGVIPLIRDGQSLSVAMEEPENLDAVDYLYHLTGYYIETIKADAKTIRSGINRFYLSNIHAAKVIENMTRKETVNGSKENNGNSNRQLLSGTLNSMHLEDGDAPVIKLANHLLSQAVRLGASDLHLTPFKKDVWLSYRVDGILHRFPAPPLHLFRSLVSRVKILANLDIAEKRLPQDGRARIQVDGVAYDLRISILPGLHGEAIVIRVLNTSGGVRNLKELGFDGKLLNRYHSLIKRPHGILLVTGPTGSGKTTTLYSTIKTIFNETRKFITLEDPVEYQVEGITQIAVNPEIGLTFARGLRSILRHDPDVILLGEIRDLESAEIAVRASLTGHLVFATLHTNDAASAVIRLVEMGVPPYMVMASLVGVLAQRLVRRLCPACRMPRKTKEIQTSSVQATRLNKKIPDKNSNPAGEEYFPAGCPACNGIGYKGRVALGELLEVNKDMRRLPDKELTPERILDLASKTGFISMIENAESFVKSGITSREEIYTALGEGE